MTCLVVRHWCRQRHEEGPPRRRPSPGPSSSTNLYNSIQKGEGEVARKTFPVLHNWKSFVLFVLERDSFPPRGWKRAEKQVNDGVNIHFIAQEKKVISLYKSPLQLLSMISIFFFYIYLAYLVQNRTLFCWKHKIKTRRFKSVNASLSLVTEHLHTTRGCRRQRGSSPLREHRRSRLTAPCIVTHVNS